MSAKPRITVSPLIHAYYPGFPVHKRGDTPLVFIHFVGEPVMPLENEVMDVVTVVDTNQATEIILTAAELYANVPTVPSVKEIMEYDIYGESPVSASALALRGGKLPSRPSRRL